MKKNVFPYFIQEKYFYVVLKTIKFDNASNLGNSTDIKSKIEIDLKCVFIALKTYLMVYFYIFKVDIAIVKFI